jgi:hypothetical protein
MIDSPVMEKNVTIIPPNVNFYQEIPRRVPNPAIKESKKASREESIDCYTRFRNLIKYRRLVIIASNLGGLLIGGE